MSDILLTALLLYTRRRPFVQNGLQIYIAELTWRIHSQSRGLPTLRLYGQLELEHLAQARKKIGDYGRIAFGSQVRRFGGLHVKLLNILTCADRLQVFSLLPSCRRPSKSLESRSRMNLRTHAKGCTLAQMHSPP